MRFPNPLPGTRPSPGKSSQNESSALFRRLELKTVEFQNRIGVSPMCMYAAVQGLLSTSYHWAHVLQMAMRGPGLMLMEATAVSSEGRITPRCLGLWSKEHAIAMKPLVEWVHGNSNMKLGIQLAHAGRKGSTFCPWMPGGHGKSVPVGVPDGDDPECTGFVCVAPSAVPYEGLAAPQELTVQQIHELVKKFGQSALYAEEAGFDFVEIHAAHGYLIHQFLSPISNHRQDEYGGSFENRCRFVRQVCEEVRRKWPETKPIWIRFSCTDWADGGWTFEETKELCRILYEAKLVDVVDCSSGGMTPQQKFPPLIPGYQVHFSREIRQHCPGLLTAAVGLISDAKHAEQLVRDGDADFVLLAREFLRNPSWVMQAAEKLDVPIDWFPQLNRGRPAINN